MHRRICTISFSFLINLFISAHLQAQQPAALEFKTQQIDSGLGVGYAVVAADLDGDGRTDLVVADKSKILWYRNPDWKRRVLLEGQTKPDNVCLAAHDIDGDGDIDLALGADWKPFNTASGGTLQWLENPGKATGEWAIHPITEEPTLHRIRFLDLQGDGKPELVVVPLMGKGSSQKENWVDGVPLRIQAFTIPEKPKTDRWVPTVLDQSLHVAHNFCEAPAAGKSREKMADLLVCSYEGISLLKPAAAEDRVKLKFARQLLHPAHQETPKGSRGASEIRWGQLGVDCPCIGTIEPWHGNQVVAYTKNPDQTWNRKVLDDRLKWGHAVHWADLNGDGRDELVVGVRDNLGNQPDDRCGIRIYCSQDPIGRHWTRHLLDSGGVAVEDALVSDLDGNGKPDIVAVGRATGNVRIYWQGSHP